jgi:hypothetical protein
MIYGKKMVLVPFDTSQTEVPKAPAPVGDYSAMDREMASILKDRHLNDEQKWGKYEKILQRYMMQLQRTKRAIATSFESENDSQSFGNDGDFDDIASSTVSDTIAPKKLIGNSNSYEMFLDYFKPKSRREKGAKIFKVLAKCSNISWDNVGALKINKKHAGNIIDLVNHALQNVKYPIPPGWITFRSYIKKLQLPISYVTNLELKKDLNVDKNKKIVTSSTPASRGTTRVLRPLKENQPKARKKNGNGNTSWLKFP